MITVYISNGLCPPYDEGCKIFARELARYIHAGKKGFSVSNYYEDASLGIHKIPFSKWIIGWRLIAFLHKSGCDRIILLPQSPLTFWAFLKAFLLKILTGRPVSIIGLQPWTYNHWQKVLLRGMRSVRPWVQSRRNQAYLTGLGFDAGFLPAGVDEEKFCSVNASEKADLRRQHRIPLDKRVVLHVGHVRTSRNLEWLIRFADEGYHVVMIGSTYGHATFGEEEEALKTRLIDAGVDLRVEYCANIDHFYKLSDVYLFPVQNSLGAIEMPLSVFEALSCGVPVVSTRFGGLDAEEAATGLFFADTCNDAVASAEFVLARDTSEMKFSPHSWGRVFALLFL